MKKDKFISVVRGFIKEIKKISLYIFIGKLKFYIFNVFFIYFEFFYVGDFFSGLFIYFLLSKGNIVDL